MNYKVNGLFHLFAAITLHDSTSVWREERKRAEVTEIKERRGQTETKKGQLEAPNPSETQNHR